MSNYGHLTIVVYSYFEVDGKSTIHITGCNGNDIVTFPIGNETGIVSMLKLKKKQK